MTYLLIRYNKCLKPLRSKVRCVKVENSDMYVICNCSTPKANLVVNPLLIKLTLSFEVCKSNFTRARVLLTYSVSHNFIAPSKELCIKMGLGEVGVSLP